MRYLVICTLLYVIGIPGTLYSYVETHQIDAVCLTPEWNTPNSGIGSDCQLASIDFLGEEIQFASYAFAITIEDDIIAGPSHGAGYAIFDGQFLGGSSYTTNDYAAGELIENSGGFWSEVGIVLYEEFMTGDTWPPQQDLVWWEQLSHEYLGFEVIRNGQPHYGWIQWEFFNDGIDVGLRLVAIGIETIPDHPIAAGSDETFFLNGPYSLEGAIFLDENENGVQDPDELLLEQSNVDIDNGEAFYVDLEQGNPFSHSAIEGEYTISPHYDPALWSITTADSYSLSLNEGNPSAIGLDFGISPIGAQESVNAIISAQTARCGFVRTHTITLNNDGNTLPNGVIRYTIDPLVSLAGGGSQPDSIVGQDLYYSYEAIPHFGSTSRNIHLQMPSLDFQGEEMSFQLAVFNADGVQISGSTESLIVTCAYDPNDKTEYNGYTEEGYILPGDELEYLIRFQNTGTDTAYGVVLIDELSSLLDLSTFQPLAASHSYQTLVDDDDKLHVIFDDIFLPDSNVNEPESHGFFRFTIHASETLSPGAIVENTVGIYFDFNPAVITNTTSNEVIDCAILADFEHPTEMCFGSEIVLEANGPIESYAWELDGELVGTNQMLTLTLSDAGEHTIALRALNPLCDTESSGLIDVLPAIGTDAGEDFSVCGLEGILDGQDNGLPGTWTAPLEVSIVDPTIVNSGLVSSGYGSYELVWTQSEGACTDEDPVVVTFLEQEWVELVQNDTELYANTFSPGPFEWYLDGDLIAITTEASLTPDQSGNYNVVVLGFNGCSATSNELDVIISGVGEISTVEVRIGPNPFTESLLVQMENSMGYQLQLQDNLGRTLEQYTFTQDRLVISDEGLSSGSYHLTIISPEGYTVYSQRVVLNEK